MRLHPATSGGRSQGIKSTAVLEILEQFGGREMLQILRNVPLRFWVPRHPPGTHLICPQNNISTSWSRRRGSISQQLTLIMRIQRRTIEYHRPPATDIDRRVPGPQIPVHQPRDQDPAPGLERPQQPRDHLGHQPLAEPPHLRVGAVRLPLPVEDRRQAARPPEKHASQLALTGKCIGFLPP